jgi:hypothetical protein
MSDSLLTRVLFLNNNNISEIQTTDFTLEKWSWLWYIDLSANYFLNCTTLENIENQNIIIFSHCVKTDHSTEITSALEATSALSITTHSRLISTHASKTTIQEESKRTTNIEGKTGEVLSSFYPMSTIESTTEANEDTKGIRVWYVVIPIVSIILGVFISVCVHLFRKYQNNKKTEVCPFEYNDEYMEMEEY